MGRCSLKVGPFLLSNLGCHLAAAEQKVPWILEEARRRPTEDLRHRTGV